MEIQFESLRKDIAAHHKQERSFFQDSPHSSHATSSNERPLGTIWKSAPKLKDPNGVEAWVEKMSIFQKINRLSEEEVKEGVLMVLEEPIYRFAKLLLDQKPEIAWGKFVEQMKKRFITTDEVQKRLQFFQRRQGLKKPLMSYIESKVELGRKADSSIDQVEMVRVVQQGLIERYSGLTLTPYNDLKSFIEAARNAARWMERSDKFWQRKQVQVNKITKESSPKASPQPSPNRNGWKSNKTRTFRQSPANTPLQSPRRQMPGSPNSRQGPRINRAFNCYACNREGHFARECPERNVPRNTRANEPYRGNAKKRMIATPRKKLRKVISSYFINGSIPGVEGLINGISVNVVLDTVCGEIVMSKNCASKCGVKIIHRKRNVPSFVKPSGEHLEWCGETNCELELMEIRIPLKLHVISKLSSDVLLGTRSVVIPPFSESVVEVEATDNVKSRELFIHGKNLARNGGFIGCLNGLANSSKLAKKQSWEKLIPYATFAYNTARHESIGISPFECLFGREPLLPTDIMLNRKILKEIQNNKDEDITLCHFKQARAIAEKYLERSLARKTKILGRKRKPMDFSKGQFVLLNIPMGNRGKKSVFDQEYHGPYRIIMRLNKNNYEVEALNVDENGNKFRGIVNVKYMKPYLSPTHRMEDENKVRDETDSDEDVECSTDKDFHPKTIRKRRRPPKRIVLEDNQPKIKRKRGRPRKPCQFAE
ncbi:Retrovirus-related Pol polyprotein from transposon-like protein [Dinothrombium tinctorium]|uniref:Retrovirus-related Pol polyprotein from transposon-like protein n=1 Tax=Dinothrombium tinctorium TaxID=1965070 RepID=A0A3S4QXU1_9ACAR|nr:Retrovirus-related Pol polyprotein from transposon-like protein [Dinothrombium tinctorium]